MRRSLHISHEETKEKKEAKKVSSQVATNERENSVCFAKASRYNDQDMQRMCLKTRTNISRDIVHT